MSISSDFLLAPGFGETAVYLLIVDSSQVTQVEVKTWRKEMIGLRT